MQYVCVQAQTSVKKRKVSILNMSKMNGLSQAVAETRLFHIPESSVMKKAQSSDALL